MSEIEQVEKAVDLDVELAAKKERSARALDHVAEIWVEMSGTDAWKQLEQELEKQALRARETRFNIAMAGTEISQREFDYDRGLVEGLRRPMAILEVARKRLARRDAGTAEPETEEETTYW